MFDSELTIVFLYKIPPFEGKIKKTTACPALKILTYFLYIKRNGGRNNEYAKYKLQHRSNL